MSGKDILAKVKAGLKKANIATGEGNNVIYLNKEIPGVDDPINPVEPTYEQILLVDAIVKTTDKSLIDNVLIFSTDKTLVSNGDVEITLGDEIIVNSKKFTVEMVDAKKPSDTLLASISIIRSL